jgi:predicted Zn-dependent protease
MASADGVTAPPTAERMSEALAAANRLEQEGRFDAAEAVLDALLAEMPIEPAAIHQKAVVVFRNGRTSEAAEWMERSIALAPASALFHRNLCEVYRALGRHDAALAIGERAVALDPGVPSQSRGAALRSAGTGCGDRRRRAGAGARSRLSRRAVASPPALPTRGG